MVKRNKKYVQKQFQTIKVNKEQKVEKVRKE